MLLHPSDFILFSSLHQALPDISLLIYVLSFSHSSTINCKREATCFYLQHPVLCLAQTGAQEMSVECTTLQLRSEQILQFRHRQWKMKLKKKQTMQSLYIKVRIFFSILRVTESLPMAAQHLQGKSGCFSEAHEALHDLPLLLCQPNLSWHPPHR